MLSNAYFLAKFRFDTAENEPAKNLQNFVKFANFADPQAEEPAYAPVPVRAAAPARHPAPVASVDASVLVADANILRVVFVEGGLNFLALYQGVIAWGWGYTGKGGASTGYPNFGRSVLGRIEADFWN